MTRSHIRNVETPELGVSVIFTIFVANSFGQNL